LRVVPQPKAGEALSWSAAVADWRAAPAGETLVSWADLWPWDGFPPALGLVLAAVALAILFWLSPRLLLQAFMAIVTRSLLWLRVHDRQRLPGRGSVLLVANPVSYLGWLVLLAACRRRVRFVILAGWTRDPWLGRLLRWAGAITLEGAGDAADAEHTLQRAGQALDRGEAVCIFAEGCRTRDGILFGYSRLYEVLTTGRSVPVVPVCLQQPWGSLLGMWNGRFVRKLPPEWFAPVEVAFAGPLPSGTPGGEARQALQMLSAGIAIARTPRRRPVHRQFIRMAARHPFRSCWIDSSAPGQDMNYAGAYVGTVCLAALLRPLLGDSPMVAIWLPPGRGAALANIALAVLGKTSVNLNYTSPAESIQSALRQCGCKHVLTARRFTARLKIDPGPGVELIHLEDLLPRVTRWRKLRALLAVALLPGWFLERVVLRLDRQTTDDLATVIFSSGSTGEPKGVMLTHGNVAANVESMIQATCLGPRDRILGVLPFFHSFGYTVALWAPLQMGASSVYHADPRQAREIGELCRKHGCSIYASTATFLRFCLKKCDPDDFRSIRILMCGAEKLPPSLAEDFRARFGVLPLEGYGCTELSPACAANMPDQEFAGITQVHNRIGTVGPPLPGCAGRVIHPETRAPLPLGEEGMLLITGANVMKGYLGKPELTREVILDSWYVTGDMARIDSGGHITLTGRLSRFAKVGGEMVPLEKLEEELHDILGTSERVCAVTCVPCQSRGERLVVLYVAATLSQHGVEVRPWCQKLGGRGLPNLWVPSERDFIAVAELPVLGSGKLNLKAVKDLALELAGRK
jgi:acyl-[acyl-carrier-protein]-phospholipid O-acyltransferase/long-chain-fatty-acid--[acyl-carrier-protein] ligase